MHFGTFIREKRLEKNIPVRAFCDATGLSQTFICRLEKNDVLPPSEEKIKKMAEILEIDSEELIFKAHKVPKDIKQLILDRPDIVPILRVASTKKPDDLKKMFNLIAGQKD